MPKRKPNPADVTGWVAQASGLFTLGRDWSAHMSKADAMFEARKRANKQQREFEVFKIRHGERVGKRTIVGYTPKDRQKNPAAKWTRAYAVRIRRLGGRQVVDIAQGSRDKRVKNPSAVAKLSSGRWVKCSAVRIRRVGGRKEVDVRQ